MIMDDHEEEEKTHDQLVLLQEHQEGMIDRSVSGDGKPTANGLRIKFKYPKPVISNDGFTTVHDDHQISRKEIRVCKVCNKRFSSGRALGGHMRVHIQDKEEQQHLSKNNLNLNLMIHHPKLKKHLDNLSVPPTIKDCKTNNAGDGQVAGNLKITCSLCGKSFPSKKSLFGHMRCHPERQWRGIHPPPPPPPPPPPAPARNSSSSTVSDSIPQKIDDQIDSATTGTMISSGSGSDSDSDGLDLAQSLKGWSVTAKRGRKSTASDKKQAEAAYKLLMLANEISLDLGLSKERTSEEFQPKKPKIECGYHVSEHLDDHPLMEKQGSEAAPKAENRELLIHKRPNTNTDDERRSLKRRRDDSDSDTDIDTDTDKDTDGFVVLNGGYEESDGMPPGEEFNCNPNSCIEEKKKLKKKKKKIKLKDLEAVGDVCLMDYKQMLVTSSDRFKCTTCFKSFPSHQALGGHRSSHKKGKNMEETSAIAADSPVEDHQEEINGYNTIAVNQTQLVEESSEHEEAAAASSRGVHRCKICNKSFPTGQALGGHKRCHWIPPPVEAPSPPEEATKLDRPMLDFDLNELPVMEDEPFLSALTHSAALDYASSSHNSVT